MWLHIRCVGPYKKMTASQFDGVLQNNVWHFRYGLMLVVSDLIWRPYYHCIVTIRQTKVPGHIRNILPQIILNYPPFVCLVLKYHILFWCCFWLEPIHSLTWLPFTATETSFIQYHLIIIAHHDSSHLFINEMELYCYSWLFKWLFNQTGFIPAPIYLWVPNLATWHNHVHFTTLLFYCKCILCACSLHHSPCQFSSHFLTQKQEKKCASVTFRWLLETVISRQPDQIHYFWVEVATTQHWVRIGVHQGSMEAQDCLIRFLGNCTVCLQLKQLKGSSKKKVIKK